MKGFVTAPGHFLIPIEMTSEEEALQMHLLPRHGSPAAEIKILYKLLIESLRANDLRAFKDLVGQGSRKRKPVIDINYVYPNSSEGTLLDVASKNGRTEFVEFLLENGANPNRINEDHNRTPIHFAVEGGHEATLKLLLNNPGINPNIEAGQQTALHMAVRQNKMKCVELLLESGASPNIPNNKGLTALHMAAMRGHRDMVNLIRERSKQSLDLDSYKDYNGQTTRQVLEEKLPDVALLPPGVGGSRNVNVHDLRYFLNSNDEKNFFRCLEKVPDRSLIDDVDELLKMAAERNFYRVVKELLAKTRGYTRDLSKAGTAAVRQSNSDILSELLRHDSELANQLLFDVCLELGMPEKGKSNVTKRLECFKLILDRDNVDVRCTDQKGNTPLHYAARAGSREAVNLLLDKGSYIGHTNKYNVPPIADIPLNTLTEYFDECLQMRRESTNDSHEYTIEFNYRCLMPHYTLPSDPLVEDRDRKNFYISRDSCEMDTLRYMSENSGLKHLLKHPLLSSFLHLKWHRIRHVFYFNVAFYFIFYVLLNAYILCTSYKDNYVNVANETDLKLRVNGTEVKRVVYPGWHNGGDLLWVMTSVALFFLIIRETLQLISSPRYYVSSLENWLELTLIILVSFLLNGAGPEIGSVAILLSAWEVVILIGQYPRMSMGIEMFKTVSWNFIRFLFLYVLLILAFALAFFTLFKDAEDDNFPDPGHSFFKTIIMLTGEFDANDIPFISYPVLSRFIFVLFVFLIAIVLFNLLNGLAVSDTADILGKAELIGLISRIRLISYVEHVATGMPFLRQSRCLTGRPYAWNPLTYLARRVLLFPNYLRNGKLLVKSRDNFQIYCPANCLPAGISSTNSPILSVHSYIVKRAKEIILQKREASENDKVFVVLDRMEEKLATIESTLNIVKQVIENNNLTTEMQNRILDST